MKSIKCVLFCLICFSFIQVASTQNAIYDPLSQLNYLSYKIGDSQIEEKTIEDYDNEIIQIINKNSNLNRFGGIYQYNKAIKFIIKELQNLQFVTDAYFDECAVKYSIFPVPFTIGVQLIIGDTIKEKCFDILVGGIDKKKCFLRRNRMVAGNRIDYLKKYYKEGFIKEQREICSSIPKYDDVWKVKDDLARDMVFKDTINNFILDSISNNLGLLPSEQFMITKYFKYIGDEEIILTRINNLPHYIAVFPQTTLVKNQTYLFNVIFPFERNLGSFHTELGFELSNGEKIMFEFKGNRFKE